MMVEVHSYSAIHTQAAIYVMTAAGAPEIAALDVKRVGDFEHPRTLVTMEWSQMAHMEGPA
jgi:hypothetical protein